MKKMNINEKEKERSYEKVILDTLPCPYAKLIAALTSGTLLHQTSSQEIVQNLLSLPWKNILLIFLVCLASLLTFCASFTSDMRQGHLVHQKFHGPNMLTLVHARNPQNSWHNHTTMPGIFSKMCIFPVQQGNRKHPSLGQQYELQSAWWQCWITQLIILEVIVMMLLN